MAIEVAELRKRFAGFNFRNLVLGGVIAVLMPQFEFNRDKVETAKRRE